MSTADGDHVPEQLVDQIVKGYDALAIEIRLLDKQRHELENRLSWAKHQYLDVLKRLAPQTATKDFGTFLDELDEAGIVEPEVSQDWLEAARKSSDLERKNRAYSIQRAKDAREKITYRKRASDAGHGVRIWGGKSADMTFDLEQDFTTPNGRSGTLKCPFVAPNNRTSLMTAPSANGVNGHRNRGSSRGSMSGRRSKRSSFHDPIRAEFCGYDATNPTSGAPSVEGSAPLCPIRFLDQHSPEEVAKYFEKHKHELPRSHETCVKRYQTNQESIQELDAKYGNLVTMIQGLGQVHQPMLPEVSDEAIEDDDEPDSKVRVQRWAASLNGADNGIDEELAQRDMERQPHFDRPLTDVRVGESPSRPWGITIPANLEESDAPKSDHTASPRQTPQPPALEEPDRPKGKCPFDHTKMMGMKNMPNPHDRTDPLMASGNIPPPLPQPELPSKALPQIAEQSGKAVPQMIFNGPVFFGYPPDQVASLLQNSTLGKTS